MVVSYDSFVLAATHVELSVMMVSVALTSPPTYLPSTSEANEPFLPWRVPVKICTPSARQLCCCSSGSSRKHPSSLLSEFEYLSLRVSVWVVVMLMVTHMVYAPVTLPSSSPV